MNKVTDYAPKGFVLNVYNAKAKNRNPISLYKKTGEPASQFKFVRVERDWYKIVPRINAITDKTPKGFVLEVRDAKVANRNPIVLGNDTGHVSQLFKFVPVKK